MERDPEQRPFFDLWILWEESLKIVLSEVEVGNLLQYGELVGETPRVVRVLSLNEDGTLTVMGIYSCKIWSAKVADLYRVDFHCVPPHDKLTPNLNW